MCFFVFLTEDFSALFKLALVVFLKKCVSKGVVSVLSL